jgi:general secretion pathway protein G
MKRGKGFTLIELLVVMAVVATLLALVGPRYFRSLDKAKETALKTNLQQARDAIDKFYGDTGRYPASLDELVTARYLREVPLDPVTEQRSTWVPVPAGDAAACTGGDAARCGLRDLRSGAPGMASDGSAYATW